MSQVVIIRTILNEFEARLSVVVNRKVRILFEALPNKNDHYYIMLLVCECANVNIEDVFSKSKDREVVNARFLTAWYLRKMLALSDVEISDFLRRDRTTIIHALETVGERIEIRDPVTCFLVEQIEAKLKNQTQIA